MFIKVPPRGVLNSYTLRISTDDSNYFEMTTNTNVYGTEFSEGWNLVKLDWETAEYTGTFDPSNVNSIECKFGDTSGLKLNGWKVDAITSNLSIPSSIEYYSNYMFINKDGIPSPNIENDDTSLIIDEGYDLLLYKLCHLACQQQHDYGISPQSSEVGYWSSKYLQEKMKYVNDLPSSAKRATTTYYKTRKPRL
jgi:hypothetical protein